MGVRDQREGGEISALPGTITEEKGKRLWVKAVQAGGGIAISGRRLMKERGYLHITGRAEKGVPLCCQLFFINSAGKRVQIWKETLTSKKDDYFSVQYRFDPVSMGVYQGAETFSAELTAQEQGSEFLVEKMVLADNGQADEGRTTEKRSVCGGEGGVSASDMHRSTKAGPPRRVVFVGNSLLLGMFNQYGMCATSPRKDYACYVQQAICRGNPDCVFEKLHGANYEHAETQRAVDRWFYEEANAATGRPACDSFTKDTDLIILQLGDNINTESKIQNFHRSAEQLIRNIAERSPAARLIWVFGWFNRDLTGDDIVRLCEKNGIEWVDIADLNSKENQAAQRQRSENASGNLTEVPDLWITHPGDRGMQKIAGRILELLCMEG